MNDFIYHYGEIISAAIGCILIVLFSLRLFEVWPFERDLIPWRMRASPGGGHPLGTCG